MCTCVSIFLILSQDQMPKTVIRKWVSLLVQMSRYHGNNLFQVVSTSTFSDNTVVSTLSGILCSLNWPDYQNKLNWSDLRNCLQFKIQVTHQVGHTKNHILLRKHFERFSWRTLKQIVHVLLTWFYNIYMARQVLRKLQLQLDFETNCSSVRIIFQPITSIQASIHCVD